MSNFFQTSVRKIRMNLFFDRPETANTDYPALITVGLSRDSESGRNESTCQLDCLPAPFANKITGDWGGARSSLAENGITVDAFVTQFYQGVTSGGRDQHSSYAGHGEYLMNVDFGKMGLQEGLTLRMRTEHRFGQSVDAASGTLLPTSILSDLPTTRTEDLILSEVLFTQFLSENVAVSFGKVNTLVTGLTPFTGGRGDDTFMNISTLFPMVAINSVPYSTLGAGIAILKDKHPILTFTILNATDTTTTSGFDQLFEDGVALFGTVSLPTPLGGKPGVQTFGFSWNNKEQVRLDQNPRVVFRQRTLQRTDRAATAFWSGFQYLQTYDDPHKGWGVFGSAGISDGNPSFIRYSMAFGIGGNSPIACRSNDRFGVAWFYNGLSDKFGPIVSLLVNPQDERGVELFCNIEVTPSIHITPDLQVVNGARSRGDAAVLLAFRAKIDF